MKNRNNVPSIQWPVQSYYLKPTESIWLLMKTTQTIYAPCQPWHLGCNIPGRIFLYSVSGKITCPSSKNYRHYWDPAATSSIRCLVHSFLSTGMKCQLSTVTFQKSSGMTFVTTLYVCHKSALPTLSLDIWKFLEFNRFQIFTIILRHTSEKLTAYLDWGSNPQPPGCKSDLVI